MARAKRSKKDCITVIELKALLKTEPNLMLIDVRMPEEHRVYNIGGKLIPLLDLPNRLHELDKNKIIITYCRSGNRSLQAVTILKEAGFETVKSLTGGVLDWQKEAINSQMG